MPKRPETPDIETEAKLVTVWNPWPGALRFYDNEVNKDKKGGIQRGLLRPEDATEIARWLSCIVGTDNVFAIYYKPQSHTTVIVEINEYDRFKHKLLGAHRWDDTFKILTKRPPESESKVYKCRFPHYRAAEKLGWKILNVESDWFKGWNSESNNVVKLPYPQTRWCDLTDEISELCLPNPTDIFPETAVRHRPMTQEQVQIASAMTTPGTSDWQEARESGLAIPNIRVKAKKLAPPAPPAPQPIQEPNSSGSSKKKIDYIDVGAMRAVLGPPICDNLPDPNAPSVKIDWANAMDEEDARDAGDSFDPIWDEPDPPEFGNTAPSSNPPQKSWKKKKAEEPKSSWGLTPSWDMDDEDEEDEGPRPPANDPPPMPSVKSRGKAVPGSRAPQPGSKHRGPATAKSQPHFKKATPAPSGKTPSGTGGKNAWAKPLGVNGTTGAGRQVRAGGKK